MTWGLHWMLFPRRTCPFTNLAGERLRPAISRRKLRNAVPSGVEDVPMDAAINCLKLDWLPSSPSSGVLRRTQVCREAQNSVQCPPTKVKKMLDDVFKKALAFKPKTNSFPGIAQQSRPSDGNSWVPTEDLKRLKEAIMKADEKHLFVRSDVGTGKSSLSTFLQEAAPELVVEVRCNADPIDQFHLVRSALDLGRRATPAAVRKKLDEKLLIIDECHLGFSSSLLLNTLIKEGGDFFVLLLSSSTAHQSAQSKAVVLPTPALISSKVNLTLRFSEEDVLSLVKESGVVKLLAKCSAESLKKMSETITYELLNMFECHRLLTVYALIKLKQGKHYIVLNKSTPDANLRNFLLNVEKKVLPPTAMENCRSAIINSNFGTLYYGQFACFRVLCEGHYKATDSFAEAAIGSLLTRGALRPDCQDSSNYIWTNPFVARHFFTKYSRSCRLKPRIINTDDPTSLVLLALSWFDLKAFLHTHGITSEKGAKMFIKMPFEDRFQNALSSGWERFPEVCKTTSEVGWNDYTQEFEQCEVQEGVGRIDFMLQLGHRKVFVEVVVFGQAFSTAKTATQKKIVASNESTIQEHVLRFFDQQADKCKSYRQALKDGQVVVAVFCHADATEKAVDKVKCVLGVVKNRPNAQNLSVLVLTMKALFRYRAWKATIDKNGTVCDSGSHHDDALAATLCAMRFGDDGRLVVNQRQPTLLEQLNEYRHSATVSSSEANRPVLDYLQSDVARNDVLKVQSVQNMCESMKLFAWCKHRNDAAFEVTPAKNTIDSLKKAIAPDFNPRQQAAIRIYDPDGKEVTKQSASLVDTTEDKPYRFQLPQ